VDEDGREVPYPVAFAMFEKLRSRVLSDEALGMPLAEVEEMIAAEGREVLDCMLRELVARRDAGGFPSHDRPDDDA